MTFSTELDEARRRLIEHGRVRLAVPFAYLLEGDGTVHEFDFSSSCEPVQSTLAALPGRDELKARCLAALGLGDDPAWRALRSRYQLALHKPRYYQEAANNRATHPKISTWAQVFR